MINVLIAYPYFSDDTMAFLKSQDPSSFRLIIDSGAFTAWNTGKPVSFEGYCQFLKSIPREWNFRAVQMDVYGDAEASYENLKRMQDLGFNDVMPVFTRGETVERLEEFYTMTDYIMFGGIAFGADNKSYIKWFNEQNRGRKVHWLGFTNIEFIKAFRPESVDSSSAMSAARYATLSVYSKGGKLKNLSKKDFAARPKQEYIDALQRVGFDLGQIKMLGQAEAWRGNCSQQSFSTGRGIASYMNVANHVYRMVQVERRLGTKIYQAVATRQYCESLFYTHKFLSSRGTI